MPGIHTYTVDILIFWKKQSILGWTLDYVKHFLIQPGFNITFLSFAQFHQTGLDAL